MESAIMETNKGGWKAYRDTQTNKHTQKKIWKKKNGILMLKPQPCG